MKASVREHLTQHINEMVSSQALERSPACSLRRGRVERHFFVARRLCCRRYQAANATGASHRVRVDPQADWTRGD